MQIQVLVHGYMYLPIPFTKVFFPLSLKKTEMSLTFQLVSYLMSDIDIFWSQSAKQATAEFFPLDESGQSLKNKFDFKMWSILNSHTFV